MSKWLAVYRNKKRRPEDERFACTDCGQIWDGSHSKGPPDGLCKCPACTGKTTSQAYRDNYRATFGHD
jgi:rubrerythrin